MFRLIWLVDLVVVLMVAFVASIIFLKIYEGVKGELKKRGTK